MPAKEESFCPPFTCSDLQTGYGRTLVVHWPEFGVAEIPLGRLLDEHAWVVGSGDTFLGDFCQQGFAWHSAANRIVKLKPVRRLSGRVLNLCSAWSASNFFHYAVDGVSRWSLVRQAGFSWDDFDYVVLPRLRTPGTALIEAALGIPVDKVVRAERRGHLECDVLVQPSFPGYVAQTPGWVPELYRDLFPPPEGARRKRRVYIKRGGARSITNGTEVGMVLAREGFETLDPLQTPDFRERLSQASHVVGVHGAGLANLVFCARGTRVLELSPTDVAHHRDFFSYFYSLCATGGMPYGVVVGASHKLRRHPFDPQSMADFELPLDDLENGLKALLR